MEEAGAVDAVVVEVEDELALLYGTPIMTMII